MKTLTKTIAIVGFTTLFAGTAMASPKIEAADNSLTSELCVLAAKGNKTKLHNHLKNSVVSKQYVANEMKCNGESVADFVDAYGQNSAAIKDYLNVNAQNIASVSYTKQLGGLHAIQSNELNYPLNKLQYEWVIYIDTPLENHYSSSLHTNALVNTVCEQCTNTQYIKPHSDISGTSIS